MFKIQVAELMCIVYSLSDTRIFKVKSESPEGEEEGACLFHNAVQTEGATFWYDKHPW